MLYVAGSLLFLTALAVIAVNVSVIFSILGSLICASQPPKAASTALRNEQTMGTQMGIFGRAT
jgi:hypothetical protein